jgi:hypothetical protein
LFPFKSEFWQNEVFNNEYEHNKIKNQIKIIDEVEHSQSEEELTER